MRGLNQALPLPPHLMEERLMMQQQQMEEDQRWLEQEESFLVTALHRKPHSGFCSAIYSFSRPTIPFYFLTALPAALLGVD